MQLVQGKGINDMRGATREVVDGKRVHTPAYQKWVGMLDRCYSEILHTVQPTYRGCTVCTEWLTFSKFKQWFDVNNVLGWELDKDILDSDSKRYSPETCCFVPKSVNVLLTTSGASRGELPLGVSWDKVRGKYIVHIRTYGKKKSLGRFNTLEDAVTTYKVAKETYARELLIPYYKEGKLSLEVCKAVMNRVKDLK